MRSQLRFSIDVRSFADQRLGAWLSVCGYQCVWGNLCTDRPCGDRQTQHTQYKYLFCCVLKIGITVLDDSVVNVFKPFAKRWQNILVLLTSTLSRWRTVCSGLICLLCSSWIFFIPYCMLPNCLRYYHQLAVYLNGLSVWWETPLFFLCWKYSRFLTDYTFLLIIS